MTMRQAVTIKVKIAESSKVLDKTMNKFSKAVQYCIDWGWELKVTSKRELHDKCYYKVKDKFRLQSQLCCNAISQAFEMIKNNPKSKPEVSEDLSIRYNFPRCASMVGYWDKLSISTIEGRVKFNLNIPKYFEKYLDWDVKESMLVKDKGRFFFCFCVSKEVNIDVSGDSLILGVDLGVNKIAVTSDNDFFGSVKQKRVQRDRIVAELQSKGTSASRQRLKSWGSRWERFMSWFNHNISKKIVSKLSEGDVLVMEDLSYIRETAKHNTWVHKWAFRQLQRFLEYKATIKGCRVVYINPINTSKQCSKCGSLHTSRHSGFFKCLHCGFSCDADLNASRNIALRYKRNLGLRVDRKPAHDLTCVDAKTPMLVD